MLVSSTLPLTSTGVSFVMLLSVGEVISTTGTIVSNITLTLSTPSLPTLSSAVAIISFIPSINSTSIMNSPFVSTSISISFTFTFSILKSSTLPSISIGLFFVTLPSSGDIISTTGATLSISITVNNTLLLICSFISTVTNPVTAPDGTDVTISDCVPFFTSAIVSLNLIMFSLLSLEKFAPFITTSVPTAPLPGSNFDILGGGTAIPNMIFIKNIISSRLI